MNRLIKKLISAVAISAIAFSSWAISLADAKQQGLVGETANGYLAAVKSNSEVSSLVKSVNEKRKKIYLALAKKNKITVEQVGVLAGKKAIAKTQSGHMVKNSAGKWVKK